MDILYELVRDKQKETDCWFGKNNRCIAHFHSCIEITYALSGSIKGMINGTEYTLEPHGFWVIPSYALHQYSSAIDGTDSIIMTIPLDFIQAFQKISKEKAFTKITAQLTETNELLPLLQQLVRAKSDPVPNLILIKGYTYTILGLLCELLGLSPIEEKSELAFSQSVLLYLDQHFLEDLTPELVASAFGYSKSHFLHLFTHAFHVSFREYLSILRCRHAAVLMIDEGYSLINASMKAGFCNVRTFYRNFKQVFGMTPSEYLNRFQTSHP